MMKKVVKILLIVLGSIFVGLGFLGVFLPLLPTTPFLLLAAGCYAKSSETFYNWLLNNRWFGQYIKNWREGRGIPLRTKVLAIIMLIATITYSILFVVPVLAGKIVLIIVALTVSLHICFQPTLDYNKKEVLNNEH